MELRNKNKKVSKLLEKYIIGLLNYKGIDISPVINYFEQGGSRMGRLGDSIQEVLQENWEKGKLDDACRMLEDNLTVEQVIKYTGLSREKIEELIKEGQEE